MKSTTRTNAPEELTGTPAASAETSLMDGELGEIKIHENVIANLVARATRKIPGVSRLAGSSVVDAIANIVGSRRMQARAISVGIAGDNCVTSDLKLNILVGCRLPEVVQQVQRAVIDNLEEVTGMTVTRVNVAVQDIDDEVVAEEEELEADTAAANVSVNPVCNIPIP